MTPLLIPGTSSVNHLRENLVAADLQSSGEAMAVLYQIGDQIAIITLTYIAYYATFDVGH